MGPRKSITICAPPLSARELVLGREGVFLWGFHSSAGGLGRGA